MKYRNYPSECPNLNVPNYWRTFRVGNLFWKFIAHTPLSDLGWTGSGLAQVMDELGMLKIVKMQSISSDGRVWLPPEDHYYEVNGKFPSTAQFRRLVKEGMLDHRKVK